MIEIYEIPYLLSEDQPFLFDKNLYIIKWCFSLFVLNYSLDAKDLANVLISPSPKKSNIYANRVSNEFNVFTTLYITTESKKDQLITELSKNFELFVGLFNPELIS